MWYTLLAQRWTGNNLVKNVDGLLGLRATSSQHVKEVISLTSVKLNPVNDKNELLLLDSKGTHCSQHIHFSLV